MPPATFHNAFERSENRLGIFPLVIQSNILVRKEWNYLRTPSRCVMCASWPA